MGPTRKEGVQGGLGKPPSCQSHPERMWRSKVTTAQKGPQGWDTCARQQPFLNPPQHSQSSSLQLCSLLPTESTSLFLGFPICTVGVTLAFAFWVLERIRGDGMQKAPGHMKRVHCLSSLLSPMSLSWDFPIHQPSTPVP